MEAQGIGQTTGGGGGGGGRGDGQVRRLHVIYFLSRRGRMEHPHLIRVHYLSKNGIRLRDVKRWLGELRGKGMPESFAWSYKRRYKTGYVWQDLLDEDLITPISDNEFILKGSEIPSNVFDRHSHSDSGKTVPMGKELLSDARDHTLKRKEEQIPQHPEMKSDVSTTPHCEFIEEEEEKEEDSPFFGSETSTMSDDSVKLKDESQGRTKNEKDTQERSDHFGDKYSSYYSTILMLDKRNKNKNENENENVEQEASSFTRSKSYSSGVASTMFRNLITCGAVETEDSAMMTINRRDKIKRHNNSSTNSINSAEVCKLDKLGGSEKMFRTPQNQQPPDYNARRSWDGVKSSSNYKPKSNYQKPVPAAYKPTNKPICSQCGKMFKPEKMHSHMRCCKGMKSMPKASASCPVAVPVASVQESISGQLLLLH